MARTPIGDLAAIEAKLRAGGDDAWLSPGELAVLFKRHRSAVDRWLVRWVEKNEGVKIGAVRMPLRSVATPGGHRMCNPDDVIALLETWRANQLAAGMANTSDGQGQAGS